MTRFAFLSLFASTLFACSSGGSDLVGAPKDSGGASDGSEVALDTALDDSSTPETSAVEAAVPFI